MQLNILDLFSGIGGFSLGLHKADARFKTIAFAENNIFCQKVLRKNFSNTKIFNDIKEVKIEQPIFIVCGGFPCQGFSVAGKQEGTKDNRYLWGEMFDIIKQTKPRWVIAENVRGIITTQEGLAFEIVHTDLESEGYEVQSFIIPAVSKGAWHKRERTWFVANSNARQFNGKNEKLQTRGDTFNSSNKNVSDSKSNRSRKYTDINKTKRTNKSFVAQLNSSCSNDKFRKSWWEIESELRGVPNGVSTELDKDRSRRIKALGNAIVPQIVETIGKAIITSEENNNTL